MELLPPKGVKAIAFFLSGSRLFSDELPVDVQTQENQQDAGGIKDILHARKGGNGSAENRTYDTAYLLGGKEQAEDAALDFRACILS